MRKIKLFDDIYAFEYDELTPYLTYVYMIIREKKLFIIDTFCGSDYMEEIKMLYPDYEYIVINTHYHFDHIWGNVSFKENSIYAHQNCYDNIIKQGQDDLEKYQTYLKGRAELVLPNKLFTNRYLFKEEQIELIYTPGHSIDSISVIDYQHNILIAGDSLEKPIIQFERKNLPIYLDTLKGYLDLPITQFFAGHTLYMNKDDIKKMIEYLQLINAGVDIHFDDPHTASLHLANLR